MKQTFEEATRKRLSASSGDGRPQRGNQSQSRVLVNPGSTFTLDGNDILRGWINIMGVHNYHPRHLIQALDFVMSNRERFPFAEIVDSKFSLDQMDEAFARAADRSVLRAAIVP